MSAFLKTILKDYVWNEAYHPRGKTTPESNSGSFAPALSGPQTVTIETYEYKRPNVRGTAKVDVIFNPDRAALKRWAGREVKMLRWVQWGNNVVIWSSYDALHQQMANALVKAGKAKSSDFKDAYWNGDNLENGPDVRTGDTPLSEMLTDYWNDVVPVKKSWLGLITESLFKWNEEDHPRGKTTPESNAGSFAPKEIPQQDLTLNGAGVITDSYDPDTVSAGLDRKRAIENTQKEVARLKSLISRWQQEALNAYDMAKNGMQSLVKRLGTSFPAEKVFYATDPKGNPLPTPPSLDTNLATPEAAAAFLVGGAVHLTPEWKAFLMDGPPKTDTGALVEDLRWAALNVQSHLNDISQFLGSVTGTASGLALATERLARLESELSAEKAGMAYLPVPTERIEPESLAVLAETQPLIEGDVATEKAQRYREEHAYGDARLQRDNPAHAAALDHYIGPGYDEMNDKFRDGENPLSSPPPAPPEKSYQLNPAYEPLYRAYYDQAYANNLKSETLHQLNKLLDQEVMRRGLESEGQIPRDEYVKLVSELRPIAEEKGKALAIQLAEKDADARAREALGVYWDDSEHARALKDYTAVRGVHELIASRPPTEQTLVLYRGVKSGRSIRLDELRPGDEFFTSGFYSTSAKKGVAQRWGSRTLEIHVPKGSRNVLVTTNDGEAEIILNHGIRLEFIGHRIRKVPLPSIVPGKSTIEVTSVFTLLDAGASVAKREGGARYWVNFGRFQTEPTIVDTVRKSWLSRLLKWSEEDHPRGKTTEGTNAGSFRPQNMGFVSPNIDENVAFQEAANRVQSHRTKLLLEADEEIADYFGISTHETVGVGAWADGAEQALIVDGTGSFEAFRAHMALSGLLAEQKAVVAFTNDAKGPDSMYRLSVGNRPLKEVHAALLEAGVQFHTLRKTDHNVDVFVFAPGTEQELQDAVAKAAERFGVDEVDFVRGYGEFIGSWDSREEGRKAYEAVLDAYEGKVPGRDGGWQALRDRWASRLAAVRKGWLEVVKGWDESKHPRGKTSPESNSGSFAPVQGELFPGGRVRLNEARTLEVQRAMTKLAEKLGPETMARAQEALRDAFKGVKVVINRRTVKSVRDFLLGSGRMKSQFETGRSQGMYSPSTRALVEELIFGFPADLQHKLEERPIYGYLVGRDESPTGSEVADTRQYGAIRFVLKPDAAARATWTEDDSLIHEGFYAHFPSAVVDPQVYTLMQQSTITGLLRGGISSYEGMDQLFPGTEENHMQDSELRFYRQSSYLEAQVHGGVRKEDVAEIHVSTIKWDQFDDEMKAEIDRLGIRVFVGGNEIDDQDYDSEEDA